MGTAGTDTVLETADIALMADDLSKLPLSFPSFEEGQRHHSTVYRGGGGGSLAAKAVLAIGVPFGFVSVVLAVLAGNVGVTLLVAGNAMRLSRVTPDRENGDV
ncbi:hypothetical protein [Halococcus sp. AFM35]|uniref:hypothetical protein n=1 Tax=Halococcus sp. AFM35 TaxID=3421653 RepID=UPI003EBF61C6